MSRSSTGSRPRPGDFGFGIKVGADQRGVTISVESELTRLGLPGLVLRSSDRKVPLITGTRWPLGIVWSINDRLRHQGAKKGRVLAIWQHSQVIAACTWHLTDSGPPVVLDLACRDDVDRAVAEHLANVLLLCLRQIAGAYGLGRDTGTLRWADLALDRIPDRKERKRVQHAVRARAAALGFKPMRPRPKWADKGWVVERDFG